MKKSIALVGNPNSGKTTLFNVLTGQKQYVGNWPGVTVEKKEGYLKGDREVNLVDLPGIYSLSPYTLEEVVSRNFLLDEKPEAIINIIDGSNLERNLYLTEQLLELSIPMIVALNRADIIEKKGDKIDLKRLANRLGCPVVLISALKETGIDELIQGLYQLLKNTSYQALIPRFDGTTEHAIAHIETHIEGKVPQAIERFTAVKLFERDKETQGKFHFDQEVLDHIETHIKEAEAIHDDDSESIIINARYEVATAFAQESLQKNMRLSQSMSDRIDNVVTNRLLGLPIFVGIMFSVYYLAVSTLGSWMTDWVNEVFFAEWVIPGASELFVSLGVADWLEGLVVDGIISGVGAVLGFVPQLMVLFILLAILEECGYMSRVAFLLDRIFRKFGLSGKSFIPMIISTGCAVPGIMSTRTIEQDRDRRMTIMTTSFMPCGAKLPVIALIAGALLGGAWWVAPSAYFIGIGAIIVSGIMLKKTQSFRGRPAPFVMELPAYQMPLAKTVFRSMWDRSRAFIIKAGTVILLSTIFIWLGSTFGWTEGSFGAVEDFHDSILGVIGGAVAWIFVPLGFGNAEATIATFLGLVAKENIVATLGVLYGFAEVGEEGAEMWGLMATQMSALAGFSFLVFNLLCAPCFAAIGAMKSEMKSAGWTAFAILYQTGFAYLISLIIYQVGMFFAGEPNAIGLVVAVLGILLLGFLLVRPDLKGKDTMKKNALYQGEGESV